MRERTVVEAAAPTDRGAIGELLAGCGLPPIEESVALSRFLVARVGARIVGSVGLEVRGPDALLRSLAVAPDVRGAGLGCELLERALAEAHGAGVERIWLLTTTAPAFFSRGGFKEVPRSSAPVAILATGEFRTICPASATCMRRDLRSVARYFPLESLPWTDDPSGARFRGVALEGTALTLFEVPAGARFEAHAHEGEQITLVLEGELWFDLDDRLPVRVAAGEAIAIPPGVRHAVRTEERAARAVDAWSPPPPWLCGHRGGG